MYHVDRMPERNKRDILYLLDNEAQCYIYQRHYNQGQPHKQIRKSLGLSKKEYKKEKKQVYRTVEMYVLCLGR